MKKILFAVLVVASINAQARTGGPGWPVCYQAGQTAVRAVDARNHGYSRADARRGESIPSNMQFGNTPQWVVEMIDPYLNAAYATAEPVDADAVGSAVFHECKIKTAGL